MAESKKPSGGSKKTAHQTRNEAAEALRQAAELIASLNSQAEAETTTKKPAAKKPAAKSGTSKAPAKKPTTKKPATKAVKQEAVEEPAQPQKKFGNRRSDCKNCGAENDKFALVCHVCGAQLPPLPEGMVPPPQPTVAVEQKPAEQPAMAEEPIVEDKPVVEQKPAEEPAPEKAEEPVAEEKPAEEKPAEQSVDEKPAQEPAPAPKKEGGKKSDAFKSKASTIINKGKLPLWIVANALLLLSSIFLMIGSFNISYLANGKTSTQGVSLFQYFGSHNAAVLKGVWQGTAGAWANGGYVMIGILMILAFLVPLALIIKNVLLLILKKNKNVHMLDAVITFTFLLAYLGIVNMYGANITWAHVIAFVISILLIAYTIFVVLIETHGKFPYFSIVNLVFIMLCVFLLTSNKIYAVPGWYAAHAAAYSGGGGFAFIMLLFALAALILLIVMQIKKFPGKIAWLFEFLVPAVAGVFALIAIISFAAGMPDGYYMGGGFVVGVVLTMLLAIVDVIFALVPKLHKFNVKLADREYAVSEQPVAVQPAAAEEYAETPKTEAQQEEAPKAVVKQEDAPVAQKPAAADDGANRCPACGLENDADSMYCIRCGRKLK